MANISIVISLLSSEMEVNNIINVIDKKDKKSYPCKIVGANENENKIKIHFIDWSDSHDEWISLDSKRIVENESDTQPGQRVDLPVNSQQRQCEEIIGRLLMNSNDTQKKVISAFKHNENQQKNEKQMGKFQVPMLEDTADYLKIKFEDANHKKLYSKSVLIRKISNRLYSILPLLCPYCNDTYSIGLNEQPLFSCHMCDRGAHNCDNIKDFHASLPKTIPRGFVWICTLCMGDTDSEVTPAVQSGTAVEQEPSAIIAQKYTAPLADQTSEANQPVVKNPVTNLSKVCPRFKRGVCPHGLHGNRLIEGQTCSFEHPRTCRKYSSFGSRGRKGCKVGSNCKFYHPILCRYSVRERLCTNEKCTFVHLKGTRRHHDDEFTPAMHKQQPMLTGGNSSRVAP